MKTEKEKTPDAIPKGGRMKKLIHTFTGQTPLSFIGQAIATALVWGGIGIMILLYLNSPTISGERLF